MNHRKNRQYQEAKQAETLSPKGTGSGIGGFSYAGTNGHTASGSEMAPKVPTSILNAEPGKPYALPDFRVSTPQGEETAQRVEERSKKRKPCCNGADRGSSFAPA